MLPLLRIEPGLTEKCKRAYLIALDVSEFLVHMKTCISA
jgi:hypothetical protein